MSALDGLPVILEPDELEAVLGHEDLVIADVCRAECYASDHLPGAIHIEYGQLVAASSPVHGLLPDTAYLEQLFSANGISNNSHVVAYDDEGGGKSARLLWTLAAMGHTRFSLLNGGYHSWANEGHPLTEKPARPTPATFKAHPTSEPVAERDYILQNLNNPNLALLDARSKEEFEGTRLMAARGGHIPGAKNWDWMELKVSTNNQRLIPVEQMQQALAERGITTDKEVVVYCHTHHRSSLTYITLKALGYEKLKGYPGSWSDWGNRMDTPVEA
jgi:thiosulfate/3-mercaptopyruvate sulfurtransferase